MCLGCSEYTKATRNHLVKCSGIEVAISGLYRGLGGHHQLEQGTHTWLDFVLNDKDLIIRPEVWEAIRGGMGKLWTTCLGRNLGVRKGVRSEGHEEGRRGVKMERRLKIQAHYSRLIPKDRGLD